MAEVAEQTGEGTLYDTENVELAPSVAYRIEPGPVVGRNEATWGGALFFPNEDEEIEAGLYVLELEEGTQVDVDVNPRSVADGDPRNVTFRGIDSFGQRIP